MRRILLLLLLCLSAPAHGLQQQDDPSALMNLPLPRVKNGAIPWEDFAKTKEKEKQIDFPDGSYTFEVTPIFPAEMKALDGQEITLYGFMFPLEQVKKHSDFLFGPFPPSCPFHYHVGPTMVVEVKAKAPISFSLREMTLKGTLRLADHDPNGVFYFLENAERVR